MTDNNGSIDLSHLANNKENVDYGSLTDEEQERLAEIAAKHDESGEEADPRTPVVTAFLVVINSQGDTIIAPPEQGVEVNPHHPPTLDELSATGHTLIEDVQAQKTASMTVQAMNQFMQQQLQQAQAAQLSQQLQSDPRFRRG